MGKVTSYKDLKIWQKGMSIAYDVYQLTQSFPDKEVFGLTSQIRRSASSIPANIAEGYGRQSTKSFRYFIKISRGSLYELASHLELSAKLNYIDSAELNKKVLCDIDEQAKILNSFLKSLEPKLMTNY